MKKNRKRDLGATSKRMSSSVFRLARNSGVALLFLMAFEVSAEDAHHCAPSLFLPPIFHLIEGGDCFSLDMAERLSAAPDALHAYLDRFPDTTSADPYRYWYYLRTRHFLPALLTLIRMVNRSSSLEPARLFRDDLAFVALNGIKGIPPEIDLYGNEAETDDEHASHRFFFILDQVASLYAADDRDLRRDAWLLYRSLALFFSSNDVPRSRDPYFERLLKHFYWLWKEGNLLSYLDFYAFFTGGGGEYLPSAEGYARRFSKLVPLPKIENLHGEKERLHAISKLVARHIITSLSASPFVQLVEADDIHRWYQATHSSAQSDRVSRDRRCLVFDEREKMLAPYKDDLLQPLVENKALAIMAWCDPRHLPPMIIEGMKIYLSSADRWFSDAAVTYGLIVGGSFSYREAASLMNGALLSALRRYLIEGNDRPFGEILRYAYHTGRLPLLCDALFLHRKYEEDIDYIEKGKHAAIRFTVMFFGDPTEPDR